MRTQLRSPKLALASCFLLLQACATSSHRSTSVQLTSPDPTGFNQGGGLIFSTNESGKNSTQGSEQYGPPAPAEQYGPEPIQEHPLVLVLGPGLARGFAYVGVLLALNEAKIPIRAIYATEIGALVGTIYSMSRSVNQFEWGLLKFKEDVFIEKTGLLAHIVRRESNGEKFESHLKQVFNQKDLSEGLIPLQLGLYSPNRRTPFVVSQGNVVMTLRAAIAVPGMMSPGTWETPTGIEKAVSAGVSRPFLIQEAKTAHLGPILVIDVLNDEEEAGAFDELKQADLVIKPNVTGIGKFDFQKRTEASFRGRRAVLEHLSDIKKLVGLP